uniref:Uncharacterized protein n=1 Tax=Mustela putorius furo TaxID=9669 RepID=M3Y1R8_MUSPF
APFSCKTVRVSVCVCVRARARARVTPPPSLPSLARPLLSLTPSAPALLQLLLLPLPPRASVRLLSRPFFLPSLLLSPTTPSAVRGRSNTSGRLSPPRSKARSHPPSLALSTPSPSPSRVGSSLSLSRADVTT